MRNCSDRTIFGSSSTMSTLRTMIPPFAARVGACQREQRRNPSQAFASDPNLPQKGFLRDRAAAVARKARPPAADGDGAARHRQLVSVIALTELSALEHRTAFAPDTCL